MDLTPFSQFFVEETFAAGTPLLKKQLYFILDGEVKISLLKPGDIEYEKGTLTPGALFGQVATLTDQPLREIFKTTRETTCWTMTRERFDALYELFPDLGLQLLSQVAEYTSTRIAASLAILQQVAREKETPSSLPPFSPNPNASYYRVEKETLAKEKMREMPFFLPFTREEQQELIERCDLFLYEKGCPFTREPALAVPYSGTLQEGAEGTQKISFVEPGKMFGALSILDKRTTIFGIAREPSILLTFSEEVLARMKQENTPLWSKLYRAVCLQAIGYFYNLERQLLRFESEWAARETA